MNDKATLPTSEILDRFQAPAKPETSAVGEFTQEFCHRLLEENINGPIEALNHYAGTNVPELNIIGEPEGHSAAKGAGMVAGDIANVVGVLALSDKALKFNPLENPFRAGTFGALYNGVFHTSNPNSESFTIDRVGKGVAGGLGWASLPYLRGKFPFLP